jgi:hypothetical protein
MSKAHWPELDFAGWRDTALTLQLWTQIVGKIRLSLAPWCNHGWQVPLYVTARGARDVGDPGGFHADRHRVRLHQPRSREPE